MESISARVVRLIEQSDVDASLTLLQAERISINYLSCHSIRQESLKILADALKEKGKSSVQVDSICIGTEDAVEGMKDTVKDLWEAVDRDIWVISSIYINPHLRLMKISTSPTGTGKPLGQS